MILAKHPADDGRVAFNLSSPVHSGGLGLITATKTFYATKNNNDEKTVKLRHAAAAAAAV